MLETRSFAAFIGGSTHLNLQEDGIAVNPTGGGHGFCNIDTNLRLDTRPNGCGGIVMIGVYSVVRILHGMESTL
jgi:hypothetical protein